MFNLVNHAWINIDCNEKIADNLVCEISKRNVSISNNTEIKPNRRGCPHLSFAKTMMCFTFLWLNCTSLPDPLRCACQREKMLPLELQEVGQFSSIFNAVGETHFSVIFTTPEMTKRKMTVVSYKRLWLNNFAVSKISTSQAKGYQICRTNIDSFMKGQGNLFRCTQDEFVSSWFVLDGVQDCTGFAKGNDEACPFMELQCPNKCVDKSCLCSPIQFKSKAGKCMSFTSTNMIKTGNVLSLDIRHNQREYNCSHNITIPLILVNDLIMDCTNGEDEPVYKALVFNQTIRSCDHPGMLPCTFGHPQCYNLSNICIYQLSTFKQLVPCRTGSHLQSCKMFQCNLHYSCPDFYCVPWPYVCNGVWDCPYGYDENEMHNCGENRSCQQMLKCRKSQICVHISDMCNSVQNCPQNDDELLCELFNTVCPLDCVCLNFAIFCQGIPKYYSNSYISYHITHSGIQSVDFLRNNHNILRMHFVANSIVEICTVTSALHHVYIINFASNQITELSQNCFNGLIILNEVVLKDNQLHRIEKESFVNICTIGLIDLSQNDLHIFSSSSFSNISEIVNLKISNNPLSDLAFNSFGDLLITHMSVHAYYLCCVKPSNTTCDITTDVNHRMCTDIFPTIPMKVTTFLIILLIFAQNIFGSLTFIPGCNVSVSSKTGMNSKPFRLLAIAVNIGNFACGFYLIVLFGIDVHFADQIVYKEQDWGGSLLCMLANMICLFYCVSVSFFLCLISVARLMVVVHPLKSPYKSAGYVRTQIVYSFSIIGILCTGIAASTWVQSLSISTQVSDKLCSPFADPTGSVLIEKVVTILILIYQIAAAFVMSVMYCLLIESLADSQGQFKSRKKHINVLFGITGLTVTHVALCLSSNAIYAAALFLPESSSNLVAWNTAVVFALPAVFIHLLLVPPSLLCKCC